MQDNALPPPAQEPARFGAPLACQAALATLALLATLLPLTSHAALYVPLGEAGGAGAFRWLRAADASLIRQGPLPGSLLVRLGARAAPLRLLDDGALLLAVPEFLCGAPSREPSVSSSTRTP